MQPRGSVLQEGRRTYTEIDSQGESCLCFLTTATELSASLTQMATAYLRSHRKIQRVTNVGSKSWINLSSVEATQNAPLQGQDVLTPWGEFYSYWWLSAGCQPGAALSSSSTFIGESWWEHQVWADAHSACLEDQSPLATEGTGHLYSSSNLSLTCWNCWHSQQEAKPSIAGMLWLHFLWFKWSPNVNIN